METSVAEPDPSMGADYENTMVAVPEHRPDQDRRGVRIDAGLAIGADRESLRSRYRP
jgi:hypothetical protein